MSLGYKIVLICVIYLSYKVVMAGGEVVLVHRNFTDSFRVGKDGCANDSSVCPSPPTCQSDSGLCLCGHNLNFLNTDVESVDGYKCVSSKDIRQGRNGLGNYCAFGPFQLIPYSHSAPATQFRQEGTMTSCSLDNSRKQQAKFPNITNNMELQWLDDSYVQFSVSNSVLSFKWKRSVPGLRGAIITLHPRCQQGNSHSTTCLRAKVFGTWPPDKNPTELPPAPTVKLTTVASAKPSSTKTTKSNTPRTKSATDYINPGVTTGRPLTSSVHPSPPGNTSSNDGGSSETIIIIAAVVAVVLLIILVTLLSWMCKRRRQNKQRNSCRGRPSRKKDIAEGKELTRRGTNGTESSAAQSNYGYSAAGDLSVIAEANPTYDATPSTARKQAIQNIAYPTEPGYDTPDLKRVQTRAKNEKEEVDSHYYSTLDDNFKGKERDAQYSTPDIERVNVNGDMYALPDKSKEKRKKEIAARNYSTPENNVKSKKNTAQYSTPDIKRVEVNGNMYALPDKSEKNKKGKRLDYLDSSQLYSDTQDKSKTSGESTLYAGIDEAVRPPQKKKK